MITIAISSFFRALGEWFNYRSSYAENVSEVTVAKEVKDLNKAIVYAEQAISIVATKGILQPRDKKRFEYFVKKFRKYIMVSVAQNCE